MSEAVTVPSLMMVILIASEESLARDKHTYIHTDIQTYIHTYIQTDRQTDRQTYRQTDTGLA